MPGLAHDKRGVLVDAASSPSPLGQVFKEPSGPSSTAAYSTSSSISGTEAVRKIVLNGDALSVPLQGPW